MIAAKREVTRRNDSQQSFEMNNNLSYDSTKSPLSSLSANVDETTTEGIYEEIYEEIPNVSLQENESSKLTNWISFWPKRLFVAGGMITATIFVFTVVLIMVVVIMLNHAVIVNKSLENNTDSNIATTTTPVNLITSCNMLPKSSPSGYYNILSSRGSAIRVYCDMYRTCSNITGGWMRVISLDMRQPSSKCPSSLCLDKTTPRTCRRCYDNYANPKETYDVGVTYSHVCGRVIAYQVGKPSGYKSSFQKHFHGVSFFFNSPKISIWSFVAASQVTYESTKKVCPCINPNDGRLLPPSSYVGSHYFCDTATSIAQPGIFYSKNPLWDGHGCMGNNTCCLFNRPPWFCRKLPQPTTKSIVMKIGLLKDPAVLDIAIEVVDIYVY